VTTLRFRDQPTEDGIIPEGITDQRGNHSGIVARRLADLR
jgi:hypothetical protein